MKPAKTKAAKPKKRAAGQGEMLMPISGKGSAAAKASREKPAARRKASSRARPTSLVAAHIAFTFTFSAHANADKKKPRGDIRGFYYLAAAGGTGGTGLLRLGPTHANALRSGNIMEQAAILDPLKFLGLWIGCDDIVPIQSGRTKKEGTGPAPAG